MRGKRNLEELPFYTEMIEKLKIVSGATNKY